MIDGEAVLLGVDGISDLNGLHSRRHNDEVQLYAFHVMALEGDDCAHRPLHLRKNNLARLLARRPEGIFVAEVEQARSARTFSIRHASSAWSSNAEIRPDFDCDQRRRQGV